MNSYVRCVPQTAPFLKGRCFINPLDPAGECDVYHVDDERKAGRAAEVRRVRVIQREEDIPNGSLVCFGARETTLWEAVL